LGGAGGCFNGSQRAFESPDADLRAAAEACLPHSVEVRWKAVLDEDWSTGRRVNFPVFRVGRLTVAPPWAEVPGSLILEPEQGFGTGQHATTRLVLERLVLLLDLEGDATPHCRVLDVGCGSGILSMAAAHLGADAYGIDNDSFAVEGARSEAVRNGLSVPFDTTPLAAVPGRWTMVLANLFADTLVDLADALIAKTEKTPDTVRHSGRPRAACSRGLRPAARGTGSLAGRRVGLSALFRAGSLTRDATFARNKKPESALRHSPALDCISSVRLSSGDRRHRRHTRRDHHHRCSRAAWPR